MKKKYSKYLFTELIELLNNDNTNEIIKELIERLLFCGLNSDVAMALIELEIYIKNNIKNEISSDFYWLSNPLKFKKKLKNFLFQKKWC